MGEKYICRAITLINYHIPIAPNISSEPTYFTMGYFDGMLTEALEVSYKENELQALWHYGLKLTAVSKGKYSYQNIFCSSNDEWNHSCTDDEFWKEDMDKKYPLTFVVFLQLQHYRSGKDAIEQLCRRFNDNIKQCLGDDGIYYTYSTVDKNDYVVCIKCKHYRVAVDTIKQLHGVGEEIVYSYSVFSVSSKVLAELSKKTYPDIYGQTVDSICLKGITNSYEPQKTITLEQKYYEFCERLAQRLFGKEKEHVEYKIYEILGETDFRFIAKNVNLGMMLREFTQGGMLCYKEKEFQFYLFSSSLVFNTIVTPTPVAISDENKKKSCKNMEKAFQTPVCDGLQARMSKIEALVTKGNDVKKQNERNLSFCHSIWQLVQSLKVLEIAPVKKYDFWTLYEPLELLIDIVEEKLTNGDDENLGANEEIYDFIHKISMTLHGTLRTDIQFHQTKDFNAIIHYAPAKLRAFYALWALELSNYYNSFSDSSNRYSFILTPGLFKETGIKQLFTNYDANKRLMLITVPEHRLYSLKRLPIVLSHEVSHFVGSEVRNREARHKQWLVCCARVLMLEMHSYRYNVSPDGWKINTEKGIQNLDFFDSFGQRLRREEETYRVNANLKPYEFHSENSFEIIKRAFQGVSRKDMEKLVTDDCENMNRYLHVANNIDKMQFNERIKQKNAIRKNSYEIREDLLEFYRRFQTDFLGQLLKMLRYLFSEAHADLTAVLTLELTPKALLCLFTKGALNANNLGNDLISGLPLCVRTGCLIQAIHNVVQKRKDEFTNQDFVKEWTKNVVKELPQEFAIDCVEQKLALDTYGYVVDIRDCSVGIRNYYSIYDIKKESFSNKDLDFLNDKEIWNALLSYLELCAETYIDILVRKPGLKEKQGQLANTYKTLEGESVLEIMQEIENFLEQFQI